jgi:ABC-type uncharacterized transport system fused permease/ATPase subunit
LREQLLYPSTNRQITDAELTEILQQVNLQNLLDRVNATIESIYVIVRLIMFESEDYLIHKSRKYK